MPISSFIKKYRRKKRTLFTSPSHGAFCAPENLKMFGRKIYACDYSEIEGFDNLAAPAGIIKEAQEKAAQIYGAKASFFLINGSSSGVIAAMLAVLSKNDKVITARNCHKCVYNGLVLTGAHPLWLMPVYNKEWGIYDALDLNVLEALFKKNRDVKAVIITNPSYEGVFFDVKGAAELCAEYGAALIIDEAHGALYRFAETLGAPSLNSGADICIQSLHKTAGALNPSALLHINKNSKIKPEFVQQALNLINTSSPSYPLLINIENCIDFLASKKGGIYISRYIENLKKTIEELNAVPNLEVYSLNNDISKILIKVKNMTGFEVSDIMLQKYGIEDELANEKSVLYLTGIGTPVSKLKKLKNALKRVCLEEKGSGSLECRDALYTLEPQVKYTPAEVWNKPFKEIDIKSSIGCISMETAYDYPPGAPVLISGEIIQKEHIEYLADKQKTVKVSA